LIEGTDSLFFRKARRLKVPFSKTTGINKSAEGRLFKANYRKITCKNGAVIDFKGLDDNQDKGISGYKRVTCLDEISGNGVRRIF
jgi:hypothetical protein